MASVHDALGQTLQVQRAPGRIVSLVPSETRSVFDLGCAGSLVGITDYSIEPATGLEHAHKVGGTKGFRVADIVALRPDLVLANKEENSEKLVRELVDAGLRVHVSFPCTVRESLVYLENLASLLGMDADGCEPVLAARHALAKGPDTPAAEVDLADRGVFVPIWRDPWMTFAGGTYADDLLVWCGGCNVFADRKRLYPLAADLGRREPLPQDKTTNRDTRYPRVTIAEIKARAPAAIWLPDEPYAFSNDDVDALRKQGIDTSVPISLVDGKDLFWYGTATVGALGRVRRLLLETVGGVA